VRVSSANAEAWKLFLRRVRKENKMERISTFIRKIEVLLFASKDYEDETKTR